MSAESRHTTVRDLNTVVRHFMSNHVCTTKGRLRVPIDGPWQDIIDCHLSDWTDLCKGLGIPFNLAERFTRAGLLGSEAELLAALRMLLACTSQDQIVEIEKVKGGQLEIVPITT